MARGKYDSFKEFRRKSVRTAKDLQYGPDVIEQLSEATSVHQITRIMTNARKNKNW